MDYYDEVVVQQLIDDDDMVDSEDSRDAFRLARENYKKKYKLSDKIASDRLKEAVNKFHHVKLMKMATKGHKYESKDGEMVPDKKTYLMEKYIDIEGPKADKFFNESKTWGELAETMRLFVLGFLPTHPMHFGPLTDDMEETPALLEAINALGCITDDGQPGVCVPGNEQREYISFLAPIWLWNKMKAHLIENLKYKAFITVTSKVKEINKGATKKEIRRFKKYPSGIDQKEANDILGDRITVTFDDDKHFTSIPINPINDEWYDQVNDSIINKKIKVPSCYVMISSWKFCEVLEIQKSIFSSLLYAWTNGEYE